MSCTVCPRYYAYSFYSESLHENGHTVFTSEQCDLFHLCASTVEKAYMNSKETPCCASNAAYYLGTKFIPSIQVPIATCLDGKQQQTYLSMSLRTFCMMFSALPAKKEQFSIPFFSAFFMASLTASGTSSTPITLKQLCK